MGSKSKIGKRRQVDFSSGVKMLSEMADAKQLEYTKQFTQNLASMRVRLEAYEDILIEKLGETETSLQERVMLRVEKNLGYEPVTTPVQKGSVVRIKIKEEVLGKESPETPMNHQYVCVGHNQIHECVDTLVLGAQIGETRDVTLPDPKDETIQRKITVFVSKIFKGEESQNETQAEPVQETPQAAQN